MDEHDFERMARTIGDLIPAEAVRCGWNVKDVRMLADGDGVVRWECEAIGPASIDVTEHRFVGRVEPMRTWRVLVDTHGTLSAPTAQALAAEVDRWLYAIGVKRVGK